MAEEIIIGVVNVTSLNYNGGERGQKKLDQLLQMIQSHKIDIMGVTEARREGRCYFENQVGTTRYRIYQRGGPTAFNGVAFIISERIFQRSCRVTCLPDNSPLHDRLLRLEIPGVTLNIIYAPFPVDERREFAQQLAELLPKIMSASTCNLLIGDFNERSTRGGIHGVCIDNGLQIVTNSNVDKIYADQNVVMMDSFKPPQGFTNHVEILKARITVPPNSKLPNMKQTRIISLMNITEDLCPRP